MGDVRLGQWLNLLVCSMLLLKATGVPVGITILQTAVAKGAGENFGCKSADMNQSSFLN